MSEFLRRVNLVFEIRIQSELVARCENELDWIDARLREVVRAQVAADRGVGASRERLKDAKRLLPRREAFRRASERLYIARAHLYRLQAEQER